VLGLSRRGGERRRAAGLVDVGARPVDRLRRIHHAPAVRVRVSRRRPAYRTVMALAVAAATFAQLLDLATFARMVTIHGPAAEANPLIASLLADHGLPFVAVTKLAGLSVIVGVIAVLAAREAPKSHPRLAIAIAAAAVAAGLFGGWTNVIVIT
jgi:hypothetical protein